MDKDRKSDTKPQNSCLFQTIKSSVTLVNDWTLDIGRPIRKNDRLNSSIFFK